MESENIISITQILEILGYTTEQEQKAFLRTILFAKEIKQGKSIDIDIINKNVAIFLNKKYLTEKDGIDEINDNLQKFCLRDMPFVGKVHISDKKHLDIINEHKDYLLNLFDDLGISNKMNATNGTEIDQVRFLGTNHILFEKHVDDFMKAVENKELNLSENCKFLLLAGKHTNSVYGEDKEPEIKCMRNIIKAKFKTSKDFKDKINNIKDVASELSFFQKSINGISRLINGYGVCRVNTVNTIREADKLFQCDDNILYVGGQPTLNRQMWDNAVYREKNNISKNDKEHYFGSGVRDITEFLDVYKVSEDREKWEQEASKKFSEQALSFCFDNLARTVYAKKQLIDLEVEIKSDKVDSIMKNERVQSCKLHLSPYQEGLSNSKKEVVLG